jgi:hypothetical protein
VVRGVNVYAGRAVDGRNRRQLERLLPFRCAGGRRIARRYSAHVDAVAVSAAQCAWLHAPSDGRRKESGAHQQARAENAMFRFKRIVGDRLRSKSPERQRAEAMIGVDILNRMTTLVMPDSVALRE